MSDASRFFQALGDETRLALLRELRRGDRTVGDLVDHLGCPQPKVSRHLRVLREAGLVRPRKEGRNVRYGVTPTSGWGKEAREWLGILDEGIPLEPERAPARRTKRARADEEASPAKPARARDGETAVPDASTEPAPDVRRERDDIETYLL